MRGQLSGNIDVGKETPYPFPKNAFLRREMVSKSLAFHTSAVHVFKFRGNPFGTYLLDGPLPGKKLKGAAGLCR